MSRARHALALALLAASTQAVAASAVAPPAFDPRSTEAAPCGAGVPPPGHETPELRPPATGATLTVRQDGGRLCYVADGIAEAPVIRARQGEALTLTLRNEIVDPAQIENATAPGTLKTANAPVPATSGYYKVVPGMHHRATGATNLHVHGFAVPPVAPQDDVLTVCTDPAVGPATCGQREFTYRYRIPAAMPEGLYWYHPHMHGEVQAQMLMGLTGAIVVEGPEHDARRAAGLVERVLVVRQTQDQDAGKTPAAAMTAAPTGTRASPHPATGNAIDTAHELLCSSSAGIDQISLDGTPVPLGDAPDAALAKFEIAAGTRQYWQLLNAATDAFLSLSVEDEQGRALPLEIAARDGSPLSDDAGHRLHPASTTEAQSVPPGGRIEFFVAAPPAGVKAYLVTHAIDTGCAGDRLPERRLAVVVAGGAAGAAASTVAAALPAAAPPNLFAGVLSRKVDRRRVIAMAEYPRPGSADRTDFYIFERKPGAVLHPYMMGDAPAITVKAGTTEEWLIENWTNELHTFHIHQLHFRVLEVDGQRFSAPELLDVVEIPYASATGYRSTEGPVRPGRVRLRMTFPADMAGDIPFHCHLVDHEDNGMMAVLRIVKASAPGRPAAHAQESKPQRESGRPGAANGLAHDSRAAGLPAIQGSVCRAKPVSSSSRRSTALTGRHDDAMAPVKEAPADARRRPPGAGAHGPVAFGGKDVGAFSASR
jgi:FtsP/CotA-like multicopper oxidase with cupredoxin domain